MKKATEDQFNELHSLVTNEFLQRVKSGTASTQDLKAACDWLKINDISGVAFEGSPLDKLANVIPKHVRDNSPGGKYAHSKKYKRDHANARAKLGIPKGSKTDASKQPDGSYKRESLKINRGRGGAKRK